MLSAGFKHINSLNPLKTVVCDILVPFCSQEVSDRSKVTQIRDRTGLEFTVGMLSVANTCGTFCSFALMRMALIFNFDVYLTKRADSSVPPEKSTLDAIF